MITSINTYTPQNKPYKQAKVARQSQNINFGEKKEWFLLKKVNEFAEKIASKEKTKDFLFKVADNKTMKALVDWASKEKIIPNKYGEEIKDCNSDKLSQYLMVGYSALLQTLHIRNIMKNKQMPDERKETLIVNNALAFVLPTIGAFTIDKSINRGIETFTKYAEKTRNKKFNDNQLKGLKTFKSVLIFGMMYKYFATIVTTPMADVTTDFLRDKGLIGKARNKSKTKQLVG
jgi:hypothetical protein